VPRWFTCPQAVTHRSINPAQCRVTSLSDEMRYHYALPPTQLLADELSVHSVSDVDDASLCTACVYSMCTIHGYSICMCLCCAVHVTKLLLRIPTNCRSLEPKQSRVLSMMSGRSGSVHLSSAVLFQ